MSIALLDSRNKRLKRFVSEVHLRGSVASV